MNNLPEKKIIETMIKIPYEDLLSVIGSSTKLEFIFESNKEYIYEKRLFTDDTCFKNFEDVYLYLIGRYSKQELCNR